MIFRFKARCVVGVRARTRICVRVRFSLRSGIWLVWG